MIEFTMSRIIAFICGALLLTVVVAPVSDYYEQRTEDDMNAMADGIANTFDAFWDSEADIMFIKGWEILPNPNSSLEIDGHYLYLNYNGDIHTSLIKHPIGNISLSYNDEISIER